MKKYVKESKSEVFNVYVKENICNNLIRLILTAFTNCLKYIQTKKKYR